MPKVRRSKKRPPEGWDLIEETLETSFPQTYKRFSHEKLRRMRNMKFVVLENGWDEKKNILVFYAVGSCQVQIFQL
ncbi:CLUMA_CG008116, isoform A [Clunio marinus]|uniref:CLUMA_CG008116, isoform A n=1 Tax=Clunio marinus TaxID=568069 RepID=A0A1J1I2S8_9DIPT|nr:CLUMA_CG008116, isoform A [Clunio marinus]